MDSKFHRKEEELRQISVLDLQNLKVFEAGFDQALKILDFVDAKKENTWLTGQIVRKSETVVEITYEGSDVSQNDVG